MAKEDGFRLARELGGQAEELTVRLRVLEESRATVRLRAALRPIRPAENESPFWRIGTKDAGGEDIEGLAFIVLMEASKSAQDDLKAIMGRVRAINEAKERQRRYIAEVTSAAAERASGLEREYSDPIEVVDSGPTEGSSLESTRDPVLDSVERADLDSVLEVLLTSYGIAVEKEVDLLRDDLDSMSDLSEEMSLRLQMHMDRLARMMSTLSNMLKKISDTQSEIVQNMK